MLSLVALPTRVSAAQVSILQEHDCNGNTQCQARLAAFGDKRLKAVSGISSGELPRIRFGGLQLSGD